LYQFLKGTYEIHNEFSNLTTTRDYTKKFEHYTNSQISTENIINDWNSLPQFIVDSLSVNDFKMLLDSHYSDYILDFV